MDVLAENSFQELGLRFNEDVVVFLFIRHPNSTANARAAEIEKIEGDLSTFEGIELDRANAVFVDELRAEIAKLKAENEKDSNPLLTTTGVAQMYHTARYVMRYREQVDPRKVRLYHSDTIRTRTLANSMLQEGPAGIVHGVHHDLKEISEEDMRSLLWPAFITDVQQLIDKGRLKERFVIAITHGGFLMHMGKSMFDIDFEYMHNCSLSFVSYNRVSKMWEVHLWNYTGHLSDKRVEVT